MLYESWHKGADRLGFKRIIKCYKCDTRIEASSKRELCIKCRQELEKKWRIGVMGENKLTIICSDDWEGLYHDGKLIDEDHEIKRGTVIKYMREYETLNVEIIYLNYEGMDWLEEKGNLPEYITEIPMNYY
jgi:hypothetical protein